MDIMTDEFSFRDKNFDDMTEPEIRIMCKDWLDLAHGRRYQIASQLHLTENLFNMPLHGDSVPVEMLRRARQAEKMNQLKDLLYAFSPLTTL
jgi:hypothetical protein